MLLSVVDHSCQCLCQLAPARIEGDDYTGLAGVFAAAGQSVLTTLAIEKNVVGGSYVSS